MPGICFYFEHSDVDVWSGKNLDAWNYAAKIAGDIDSMIVINKTDQYINSPDADLQFHVVSSLDEANRLMSGVRCHLACPWNPISRLAPIMSLDQATVDWYVFGPANGWTAADTETGYFLPQATHSAAHSVHVATATMFYRFWSLNSGN